MKKERSIPSILGLVLLLSTLFGGSFLVSKSTSLQSNASETCQPKTILVTNISPTSFDFIFTSDKACDANLKISDQIFVDTRQPTTPLKNHYFKATNLKPDTEYKLELITGGEVLDLQQKIVKTYPGGSISKTNGDSLAWGKVFKADKSPAKGSILYLEIPGATTFSSFVTDAGNWSIPTNLAYFKSGSALYTFPADPIAEEIRVIDLNGKSSDFTTTTNNNQPVPDIYLDTADFKIPPFVAKPKNTSNTIDTPLGGSLDTVFDSGTTVSSSDALTIKYPKSNEKIGNSKPEFFGSAKPNSQLILTLTGPSTKNSSIISNTTGDWKWSPDTGLNYGAYNLKLEQSSKSAQVSFSISSEDTSLAFVSTPSAVTTVPSPSPSPNPTAIPTSSSQSTTPTKIPTPTIVQPTSIPITTTPIPKVMPKSGGTNETFILLGIGLLTTLLGGLFLQRP